MADAVPEAPKVKIIYKKKKGGHGHHGGAWKVAFADFMTAMMALFLVLWIMAQSQEVKQAVAYYFRHPTDYEGEADAILRGNMGLMDHKSGRMDVIPNIVDSPGGGQHQTKRPEKAASTQSVAGASARAASEPGLRPANLDPLKEELKDDVRTFLSLADLLWDQLKMDPSFMRVREQVMIQTHEEGLVVQIVERPGLPLFEAHSDVLRAEVRGVLATLAAQIKELPNKLEIDGHGPGLSSTKDTIWLGSAHLAERARLALLECGLRPEQIVKISGCADTRPLNPKDAEDGLNRRISILVRPRQWQPERF